MCVYIAVIATILAMILWHVDCAAALKCNDYRLESWLAGHSDKGSVQHGKVYAGGANFLIYQLDFDLSKINHSKRTKSHMFDMPLKLTTITNV